MSNEKWGYDRGFSAGVISERSTIAAQIEQAVQKERERIIAMLVKNEDACPYSPGVYCHAICEQCWRAYLEPQKKPEEGAEGAGE